MEIDTKVIGFKGKQKGLGNIFIKTGIFMKANSKMINEMVKEPLLIQMEINILENGLKMCIMDMEFINSLTEIVMKETFVMEKGMAKVNLHGMI